VVGDDNFNVTKGKSKDYYNLLIIEKAKPPNIIQKLQSNFHFNSDNLKQIFKLPHSIIVESYVKAFQYKVINSVLYTNTKLYKIGFRTNDLCTFCDNQPESSNICSITAHALNSFGVNLNYIGALFRINEFVSAWKMCSLENSICGTAGANKTFQIFMDLEPRSSLNMKQKKKSATKIL